MCRSKNAGVAGYAEAFRPVHSDLQTSEWYSYFENDVLDDIRKGSEKQWEAYSPTAADYRRATGFEALMGYLYLKDDFSRIIELVRAGIGEDKI